MSKETRPAKFTVTIYSGKASVEYMLLPVLPGLIYHLEKADSTRYTVMSTEYGVTCDCPNAMNRHKVQTELCKHARSLVELGVVKDVSRNGINATIYDDL